MIYYIFSDNPNNNIQLFMKFLNNYGTAFTISKKVPPMYLQKIYMNEFREYVTTKELDNYKIICYCDNVTSKSYIDKMKSTERNYDIVVINYLDQLNILKLFILLELPLFNMNTFPKFISRVKTIRKTTKSRRSRNNYSNYNTYIFKSSHKNTNTKTNTNTKNIKNTKKIISRKPITRRPITRRNIKLPNKIIKKEQVNDNSVYLLNKSIYDDEQLDKLIKNNNNFVIDKLDHRNDKLDAYKYPNNDMLLTSKLLIFNGALGDNTNGGIYNPGFIKHNDKMYLLCRGEQISSNFRTYHSLYTSKPILVTISASASASEKDNLKIVEYDEFSINLPSSVRVDDFRLYKYNNEIYTNHKLYTIKMGINGEHMESCSVGISKVDILNKKLHFMYELQYKNVLIEKNWGIINKRTKVDDIYVIKNVTPYTLLKLDHDTGECVLHIKKYYNLLNIHNWSLSTNPIIYNDKYYVTFIHHHVSVINQDNLVKKKLYSHYLMFIDRETLLPSVFIPTPLYKITVDEVNDINKNYVHYISSLFVEDDKLYIFYGEAELNTGYDILNKNQIDKEIEKCGIKLNSDIKI